MPRPAVEVSRAPDLGELLEQHYRAWRDAGSHGPRSVLLEELWESALLAPSRSFLERPGKHFRARLVTTAWLLAGGELDALPRELPFLVEILHAGSLIVDDVQDQADERRGSPALHRLVGTPLAINTGNLFYCWALELLQTLELPPRRELALYRRASDAMLRCHHGQALDLTARMCETSRFLIPQVVEAATALKTGALMELAAALGAIPAGADDDTVAALTEFAHDLGVGLQMLDDLSGVLNPRRRDKAVQDLRLSRPTWVWCWLANDLDARRFIDLQDAAREVADGAAPDSLIERMGGYLGRTGRCRVHDHLRAALAAVSARFEPSGHLTALRQEVERLESSYV